MRHPAEQRYAVIPPYAARWLLTQMATGQPVTKATVQARARELIAQDSTDRGRILAGHLVGAFIQLERAALDGEPTAPSVLTPVPSQEVPRPEPLSNPRRHRTRRRSHGGPPSGGAA